MTKTSQHTPGPWSDNDNGLILGDLDNYRHEAPFVADVCISPDAYTDRERANCRLIAAAPDMLAALEFVSMTFADIEASKRKGYYTECPKIVAAVITKATGGAA